MKTLIEKDKKRRYLTKKYEFKRLLLKYIIFNQSLDSFYRQHAQYLLNKLPKDSSRVRVKNRCIITGRAKSVYRQFRVSRIVLKNFGLNGVIPGLRKASW
jgi:small subunit ribosomal protein S14